MKIITKQQGFALLMIFTLIAAASAVVVVKALNNNAKNNQIARDMITATILAQAKNALIGYATTYQDTHTPHLPLNGYLPNPDLGPGLNFPEGSVASSSSQDITMIGKLPWRELGLAPLLNGNIDCLWYVVSGRFKNSTKTTSMNWDTQGQIDVIDASGNQIASNLAALVIAPGNPLDGQSRSLVDANHTHCGGNYDARNYLDPINAGDAISGQVNYFSGSTNNSRASNTSNKTFVLASSDHYNDQMIFITVDDVFRYIITRNDFTYDIQMLMEDSAFLNEVTTIVVTSDSKGTGNLNCNHTNAVETQNFCKNWKEMLLLTKLPAPTSITIDDVATPACSRVLIFGGRKTATQLRLTSADKLSPANYLEGVNLSGFATPTSAGSNFNGVSTFVASTPSADIMRCIP